MRVFSRLMIPVAIFLIGLSIALYTYTSDWFQKRYIYPFPNQDIVFHYSLQNDLDPFLVAAVIRTESKFLPRARSPRGAFGLMQMMPETAMWVAKESNETAFNLERLAEPEVSIRMGTWYLANLNQEFKRNPVLVLAAYNAGRGNVKEWIQHHGWSQEFSDTAQIPFKETREYVGKVLSSRQRYAELYGR